MSDDKRMVRWFGVFRGAYDPGRAPNCHVLACDKQAMGRQKGVYVDEDSLRESRRTKVYIWPCVKHAHRPGQITDVDA